MARLLLFALILVPLSAAIAQDRPPTPPEGAKVEGTIEAQVTGHVLRPRQVDATQDRISAISLPAGFQITVWAEGLEKPRWMAAREDGSVYVTSRDAGTVTRLRDTDGDGKADENQQVVKDKPQIHGIWIDEPRGQVFLVDIRNVYVAPLNSDGTFGELKMIFDGLPDGGQHNNRTLAVGPDGKLYVSVGSLTNDVPAEHPFDATLVRMDLDGQNPQVFAQGLRNTIGFAWHPRTGVLWGMDHGIDWLGDDIPLEELNKLEEGKHYGHPWIWNDNRITPNQAAESPKGYSSIEDFARQVPAPVLTYDAHAAPLQMAFYTGDAFPEEYRGDAFVAMRGSWNRQPPSGYELARIDFDEAGKPLKIERFAGRWLSEDGRAHFGRLCGVAVLPDGSLLVGDDTNGVIYRIEHSTR
jgi:glucose/arabinose dehydrogenase